MTDLGILGIGLFAIATGAVGLAALQIVRTHRDRRWGALVQLDSDPRPDALLRSDRFRLVGRPDEVRVDARGRRIPIEFKSRNAPPRGPWLSHRVQVAAYCLLIEETVGTSPPFGIVRYGDGVELRVPWNAETRIELFDILKRIREPYDGRADPSPAKCRRCAWSSPCDVRAF